MKTIVLHLSFIVIFVIAFKKLSIQFFDKWMPESMENWETIKNRLFIISIYDGKNNFHWHWQWTFLDLVLNDNLKTIVWIKYPITNDKYKETAITEHDCLQLCATCNFPCKFKVIYSKFYLCLVRSNINLYYYV